ncbi:hypothetical protein TSUD_186640 [Trifolium subterraneum]|uniref:RRM domain-containing protein n=1 Tax=Trifolium subterraneum TaxID=3900 RepID=A0A2Z6PJ24_TRISU|nr:hypothetical protein TSUD_186640 [Trifolium subterraneum]
MAESWLLSQPSSLLYTKTKFPIISNSIKPFKLQNPSSCNNNSSTFSPFLPLTTGRRRTRHSSFLAFAVDEYPNVEDPNGNLNVPVRKRPAAYDSPFGICVTNLPGNIDSGSLEKLFGKYGKVESVEIVRNEQFGIPSSTGFLIMASKTDMDNAIAAFNGLVVLLMKKMVYIVV